MSEKLYFQWQNDTLRKTIYPMREEKLRDFLVFCHEIDLWEAYKDRNIDSLQDEIAAYIDARSAALAVAFSVYDEQRTYFLAPDASAEYAAFDPPDVRELNKINRLHSSFITYLPRYTSIHSEESFTLSQAHNWKEHCRRIQQRIAQKARYLDNMQPDHPRRPEREEELHHLQNVTLVMAETELEHLNAFVRSIEGIRDHRLEFDQRQQKARSRKKEIQHRLPPLERRLKPLEKKQQELAAALQQFKAPPDMGLLLAYFSSPDASTAIRARSPEAEQALIDQVNALHHELMAQFNRSDNPAVRLSTIRNHAYSWKTELQKLEKEATKHETNLRNMSATWSKRPERESRLKQIREVDAPVLAAELDRLNDFRAAFEFSITPKAEIEKDIQAKEVELKKTEAAIFVLTKEIQDLISEARAIDEQSDGALEKFITTYVPDHVLTSRDIAIWKGNTYRESLGHKDQTALLEEIAERFWAQPERFPLWLQYMVIHFSGMRYASAHGSWADPKDLLKRLQEHKQETGIEIPDGGTTAAHLQTEEEAQEVLRSMKGQFPAWAWKQIVSLTPLRVTEVTEPDWEMLTTAEIEESYAHKNNALRALLNDWKNDHITAWRDAHGRTHQLIVTRAVCNETAEHCQHLRGHLPPGGLAAKGEWYLKQERENTVPGAPHPYFCRPGSKDDFTEGASILWLRFVDREPNAWQTARPIVTKDGIGLLPDDMGSGGWNYAAGDTNVRTRRGSKQWLRWIHEATVAEVTETAEGKMVMTFETALPEDEGDISAVGVFMKPLWWFLIDGPEETYNRCFTGYVPEGTLPEENLARMLDWEKILRRKVEDSETKTYRKVYPFSK